MTMINCFGLRPTNSRDHMSRLVGTAIFSAVALGVVGAQQPQTGAQPKPRMNRLIEQLEAGKPAITGLDHIWIDMEHGPFSLDRLEITMRVLEKVRNEKKQMILAPLVRIPVEGDGDSRFIVKQVLERNVLGIVFPHVETKEQALKIIRSMRYEPQRGAKYPSPPGDRGRSMAQNWGLPAEEYLRRADVWPLNPEGELFGMLQIEDAAGVQNINDILDVPGIGAVFLGPNDLGMSLGTGPGFDKPEVEAATQTVLKACLAKKVACATIVSNQADLTKRIGQGFKVFLATWVTGGGMLRLEMGG